jgi:N-acetylneuraminic acid mutarotase
MICEILLFSVHVTTSTGSSFEPTSVGSQSPSDSVNRPYWTISKDMPEARNELSAVGVNEKIYVIGGEDIAAGGSQKDTIEIYDSTTERWLNKENAPLPQGLDHTAAVEYIDKIYVAGGFLQHKIPSDKLYIYDINENEWTEGESLPSARGALTAEIINGTLYAIGGLNSSQIPVNTNEAYDLESNSWTTKTPMPTARHHLSSAVVDGRLFALGGRILGNGVPSGDLDEARSNFGNNEVYDPQTDSWSIHQPMLTKRSGFTAATAGGEIYVFGGEGIGESYDSVERYDPENDVWHNELPMPTERMGLTAVPFTDKIYVLGGQIINNGSGLIPLKVNEVFHINKSNNTRTR